MRLLALAALLAACSTAEETSSPDAAPTDARATMIVDGGGPAPVDGRVAVFDASVADAPRIDAGPAPDAGSAGSADAPPGSADAAVAGSPDAAVAGSPDAGPLPANVGWIGGSCNGTPDCHFDDAICLGADFPRGLCTEECTGLCPDRHEARDTVTACIDGRPFGFDQGLCVSRCDTTVFPGTGCAAGYHCLPKSRYLDPPTILSVCVPDVPANGCPDGADELVHLDYPQAGAVWIPAEAQCGAVLPLVVMMHGINRSQNATPSLGGGRRLEYEVRSLIDAHLIAPVLLAEPVQDDANSASSATLYDSQEFDPAHHLALVQAILDPRGIAIASLSYTGHSGAGCDPDNGLYLILDRFDDLIPTYAPEMRLWGLEDICYSGSYHYQAPIAVLENEGTVIFDMFTVQGDPTEFEDGLMPDAVAMSSCPDSIYTKCIHDPVKPWCSYRTSGAAGITHDDNPWFFVREAFPQVFPAVAGVAACR